MNPQRELWILHINGLCSDYLFLSAVFSPSSLLSSAGQTLHLLPKLLYHLCVKLPAKHKMLQGIWSWANSPVKISWFLCLSRDQPCLRIPAVKSSGWVSLWAGFCLLPPRSLTHVELFPPCSSSWCWHPRAVRCLGDLGHLLVPCGGHFLCVLRGPLREVQVWHCPSSAHIHFSRVQGWRRGGREGLHMVSGQCWWDFGKITRSYRVWGFWCSQKITKSCRVWGFLCSQKWLCVFRLACFVAVF